MESNCNGQSKVAVLDPQYILGNWTWLVVPMGWGVDSVIVPAVFVTTISLVVPVNVLATGAALVEPIRSCPFVKAVPCRRPAVPVVTISLAEMPESVILPKVTLLFGWIGWTVSKEIEFCFN